MPAFLAVRRTPNLPTIQRSNNTAEKPLLAPGISKKGIAGVGMRDCRGESGSWGYLPVLVRDQSEIEVFGLTQFGRQILRIAFALSTSRHPELAPRYSSNKSFGSSRAISDVSMSSFTLGQASLIAIPYKQGACRFGR